MTNSPRNYNHKFPWVLTALPSPVRPIWARLLQCWSSTTAKALTRYLYCERGMTQRQAKPRDIHEGHPFTGGSAQPATGVYGELWLG